MDGSIKCSYCNVAIPDSTITKMIRYPSKENEKGFYSRPNGTFVSESTLMLTFYECPTCGEFTIYVKGIGEKVKIIPEYRLFPQGRAKKYPNYIPKGILQDYEEACSILDLSPKASATLARRCLQGMINDYWGITKSKLFDAINELEGRIPAGQWKAIDGLRRLGNIGAHMEKDINQIIDIDPDEAQKLIVLIELLFEQWYINRHEQEKLYESISNIDENKQLQRKEIK